MKVGEVEDVEKAESRSSERGKDALGSGNGNPMTPQPFAEPTF